MAPTPRLEASGDGVEQPGFLERLLVKRGPAEETRAQLGIPADVVTSAHLVLEESRQEQALRARCFHHEAVVQQCRVGHEVVEDRGVKILVDPKAVLFLLGTEMDYKADKMQAQFVFNNPNQTSACGCSESVTLKPATEVPETAS